MLNRRTPTRLLALLLTLGMSVITWAADSPAPTIVENASPGRYRVAFTLQIDDRPTQSFGLGDRAGTLMQANLLDQGERIGVEAVVHETADPQLLLLKMHLTRAGKPIGEPAIAVMLDQAGRIEIGQKGDSGFNGVRLDATISREQGSAFLGPMQPQEAHPALGRLSLLSEDGEGC